jgi:Ku70/Ku80 beta-barrel domain
MAPRANWKGYLRLSLVSCPILLYPATSEAEKVHFHQLNKATGNRIHLKKVDAETDEIVPAEDIIKGYEVGKEKATSKSPTRTSRRSTSSRLAQSTSISSYPGMRSTISTSIDRTTSYPTARSGGRPSR